MGLWSRLIDTVFPKADSGGFRLSDWGEPSASGLIVNQLTAMQSAAVMACVSYRAEDVAKLRPQVYRRRKDGSKVAASEHPLFRILQRPNNWQTNFEFFECMHAALLLRSNAYAVKLRNVRGDVLQLVPINPDRVTLFESPTGDWFYAIARRGIHEAAVLRDLPIMVPSEDVVHLRWLSQVNSLLGMSRVGLMREPIGLALAQEKLASRMAGNGTKLSGTLETDQKLSELAAKRMAEEFAQAYGGLRNAGRTAVLEQGLKFKPMSMTASDAEFTAQRAFQLEEIARAWRMPPHKLGIIGKGTASSMVQMDQDYLNNTILPDLERWEQKLQNEDWGPEPYPIDGVDVFVEFDVSRFLRADIKTRFDAYRSGIAGSFMKPNEVRVAEGLGADPNGDNLLQPVNFAPLGFIPAANAPKPSGPGSDLTGQPGAGGDGDPTADPSAPTS